MGLKARPAMPPEVLERFRQAGLRLDRHGHFWHEGLEVTHPRLHHALLSWLDRLDDGRRVLRLDAERYVYLEVEDADLLVTSLSWQGSQALLHLNDGSEEALDPTTLTVAADNAVYCKVRAGRLVARLTTAAYYALAERIDNDGDGFVLRVGGARVPIGQR